MLNSRPLRTKTSPSQQLRPHQLVRNCRNWLLRLALVSSGCLTLSLPLLANLTPASSGQIKNTATGTFVDDADTSATPTVYPVESNTVVIAYAEVAGIDVSIPTAQEAPATIPNPGSSQGDGKIGPGDLVYYDFTITNIGNDPTQFFIPGVGTASTPGTPGSLVEGALQIVSYNSGMVGSSNVVLSTPIPIPAAGERTGKDSFGSAAPSLLGDNGVFQAGGSVTVRIPVRIPTGATNGNAITVRLGNTTGNAQNQAFAAPATNKVYTIDNNDNLIPTFATETAGVPANGEREASNQITTTLVLKASAKLLVVKRITRLGNLDLTTAPDPSGIAYDPTKPDSYDSHPNWPTGYLKGSRNITLAKKIQPGEEIEYTLYFMNVGEQDAQKVKICDFITPNQVYSPATYNPAGNGDGGYGDMGIELTIGQNPSLHLSGTKDPDRGEYLLPGVTAPPRCGGGSNTTGLVIIDVTKNNTTPTDFNSVPPALNQADPNSYGLIRFRTKVN
jgi:uncharacterized repeat protein (TIGR01451 family)